MAPLLRAAIGVACAAGTVGVALGAQPQSPDLASASGDATALLQLQNPPEHPRDFPPGGGLHLDLQLLMDDHVSDCDTVFLTTVLGSRHDPVRGGYIKPDFGYFERFYRSILAIPGGRAKAVILHDFLPENMTSRFTTADGSFSFVKVDISNVDHLLGLNDLRYQLYEEEVKKHPEWDTVFMTDSRDVVVLHNPCVLAERQPDKVFVGSQQDSMKPRWWFNESFHAMGGKYLEWYEAQPDGKTKLSAGIMGGKRDLVLKGLAQLNAALMDPELELRKKGHTVAVNMAAFNYVFHGDMEQNVVTGHPVHSKWNEWENRTDVYFWHH
mmetsp:Transcript_115053/g.321557  ORF Transcript_115053/g.321557 Transcript_115053/m.321557 type:complete len:325 (+) Transcript_115053:75-1049(+)